MAIVEEDEEKLAQEISKISQEGGELAMTTYARLINKGIEQGMSQGMIQGKIDTAKQFKAQGVSIDIISKATGLSK